MSPHSCRLSCVFVAGGVREGGDVGLLVSPRATWPRVSGGGVGESKDPDDFDESDLDEDEVILLLSNELPDAPEGRGVGLDEGGGVGLGTGLGMDLGEGGGVVLVRGLEVRHAQPHAGGACEAENVGTSGRGPMKNGDEQRPLEQRRRSCGECARGGRGPGGGPWRCWLTSAVPVDRGARLGTATGSSWGFEARGSARMATNKARTVPAPASCEWSVNCQNIEFSVLRLTRCACLDLEST